MHNIYRRIVTVRQSAPARRALGLFSLSVLGGLLFTGCADTELRPAFTSIEGLQASLFEPASPLSFSFAVRNVGEGRVTIQSVTFADNPDENFFDVQNDLNELLSEEQMVVQFNYRTPNGVAQEATLVIESDATQNPTLEVPVATAAYVEPQGPDAGPGGDDAGNPGGDDAGNPGSDDAGNPGSDDAGNPGSDDAGNPGSDDAGNPAPADAGAAGNLDAGLSD